MYINGKKRKIKSQMMLEYFQRRQLENPSCYKVVHLAEKKPNLPPYKKHTTIGTYAAVIAVFLLFLAILSIFAKMVMR